MKVRNNKNKIVQRILSLCLAIAIVLGIAIGTIVPAFAAPTMDMMVTDDGNMLSAVEEASIEDALFNINQQTGIEFAVYTIESLDGTDIEAKANDLFRQLGLGEEENDNGLLLLISRDDREFRLEVGYGLEGCITDTQAMQAINAMTPYFRAEQYANGIRAAIIKIVDVLNQDGVPTIQMNFMQLKNRAQKSNRMGTYNAINNQIMDLIDMLDGNYPGRLTQAQRGEFFIGYNQQMHYNRDAAIAKKREKEENTIAMSAVNTVATVDETTVA